MERNIIQIDEELCNGCGNCVIGCAEGALQIVNGKAKVVNEKFCDGFGDCIGVCPTGALEIIEREADEYDEEAARKHIRRIGGEEAVKRFDEAAEEHAAEKNSNVASPAGGGCPGTEPRFDQKTTAAPATQVSGQAIPSELRQWPTQLHLVPTEASFFKNRELVVLSTCAPSASPDVNWRFVRGRAIVIVCPKLDRTGNYLEKLAQILKVNGIPKVIIVRMEVSCCSALTTIVKRAAEVSSRTDLIVEEAIIGLNGDLVKIVEI